MAAGETDWEAAAPQSFVEWSYRCTPRRPRLQRASASSTITCSANIGGCGCKSAAQDCHPSPQSSVGSRKACKRQQASTRWGQAQLLHQPHQTSKLRPGGPGQPSRRRVSSGATTASPRGSKGRSLDDASSKGSDWPLAAEQQLIAQKSTASGVEAPTITNRTLPRDESPICVSTHEPSKCSRFVDGRLASMSNSSDATRRDCVKSSGMTVVRDVATPEVRAVSSMSNRSCSTTPHPQCSSPSTVPPSTSKQLGFVVEAQTDESVDMLFSEEPDPAGFALRFPFMNSTCSTGGASGGGGNDSAPNAFSSLHQVSLSCSGHSDAVLAELTREVTCSDFMTTASMSRAEDLSVAAQAVGEWARGPISRAIRNEAVGRHEVCSVTRHADLVRRTEMDPCLVQRSTQRRVADVAGNIESQKGSSPVSNGHMKPRRLQCVPETSESLDDSTDIPRKPHLPMFSSSSRSRRVPLNTVLGRIVASSTERVHRHGLVAVPPWVYNNSWPPRPPAEATGTVSDGLIRRLRWKVESVSAEMKKSLHDDDNMSDSLRPVCGSVRVPELFNAEPEAMQGFKTKLTHSVSGNDAEPHSGSGDWPSNTKMQAISKLSKKMFTRRQGTKSDAGAFDSNMTVDVAAEDVDFAEALEILDERKKKLHEAAFKRFSEFTQGTLTHQGLQRAMEAVGIRSDSFEEQKRLKSLQERVMKHCRDGQQLELANPLTDPKGVWLESEFLLFGACANLVMQRQVRSQNMAITTACGVPLKTVEELRSLFVEFDTDGNGIINRMEFTNLVATMNLQLSEGDITLLFDSVGSRLPLDKPTSIHFQQFVHIMCKVEEMLSAS
eukprot:TRINITY_DN9869_c0_g1_i1.p1 TRINITY_DN9869_c0_g1~~TRINITY_DN9869_c0_g1_i1.p1  ORF type:complete len:906 (+),score=128.06 TRINITY_DN9869_c0_g1_i1:215-2719(+)